MQELQQAFQQPVATAPIVAQKKVFSFLEFIKTFGVGITLIFLCIVLVAGQSKSSVPQTVTTTGLGRASYEADKAMITVLYTAQGAEKSQLIDMGQAQFRELESQFLPLSVTSFTQSSYQLIPATTQYDTVQNRYPIFEYRQAGEITVIGKENIPLVLDALARSNFSVTSTKYLPIDEATAKEQLLQAAMKEARTKAEVLAQASGRKLGKVHSVAEVAALAETGVTTTKPQENTATGNTIELGLSVNVSFLLN